MKKQEFSESEALKIAKRIRGLIPEGMSQTTLAKEAGISQPSMSEILAGQTKQFKAKTAASLAKALKCTSDYLLLLRNTPHAQAFSDDEQILIEGFRLMGDEMRGNLLETARGYIARSEATKSKAA